MVKAFYLVLALVILQLTGCTSVASVQRQTSEMGNLLLAEPAPVSMRSQMALARLEQLLNQIQQMPSDQQAELLYQRGVLYDSVGLSGLAQYDFNRALRLKPDMPEVYNFLGIQYTQSMDFLQAYEAFDATLEIDPAHEYAFLNRGIALYYGGRPELAVDDLNTFYQRDTQDPYRALWTYIAEAALDEQQALEHLREIRKQLDNTHWATLLVDFYLGNITEKQVLGSLMAGVQNQRQLSDKLCEAYFYLGKYHRARDENGVASNYFKLALSTNIYEFVEHRYARLELDLLRDKAFQEVEAN